MAILGLMADNGRVTGSIRFEGDELVGLRAAQMNRIRGDRTRLSPHSTGDEERCGAQRAGSPSVHAPARHSC
jgi:hypothetical protein